MWAAIALTALVLVGASARTPNDGARKYTESGDCKVFKYLFRVIVPIYYHCSALFVTRYPSVTEMLNHTVDPI